MTREEFIRYLKGTLIPDLRQSGSCATAADFAAAVLFMEGANEVEIGEDDATPEEQVMPDITDEVAEALGQRIIELFGLKVKPNGRVDTSGGDKTPIGLGKTVLRAVEEETK